VLGGAAQENLAGRSTSLGKGFLLSALNYGLLTALQVCFT
jgi:hypothetical protein